jgi:glycerol-3-phosphate acyltransferase PlsX
LSSITLAIDIHGGDRGIDFMMPAIATVINGSGSSLNFILCGVKSEIEESIKTLRLDSLYESGRILIEEATNTSQEETSISRIWRTHPDSSLVKSISLQQDGRAHATLSAGDTGALFASSIFLLGKEDGVSRPALAATLPSEAGRTVLLLDVGASLDCRAEHLANFGKIGFDYMSKMCRGVTPKVGLLNVGKESYKGTAKIKEVNTILEAMNINYSGYIEGSDILTGEHTVVVCDGFSGNLILKNSEQLFRFMRKMVEKSLSEPAAKRLDVFNSEIYGSVPILGIRGNVFKAHGGSSINALTHAVATAVKTVYLLQESKQA